MAEAKLTWRFTLYDGPDASVFSEEADNFKEVIKAWQAAMGRKPKYVSREWANNSQGYPIFYITKDNGCLCPKCANDNLKRTLGDDPQWKIEHVEANWENTDLYCDNCNKQIHSAYGDDS